MSIRAIWQQLSKLWECCWDSESPWARGWVPWQAGCAGHGAGSWQAMPGMWQGRAGAGNPSRLQVPLVIYEMVFLAAASQTSRYCATQPSWKLNLREWYMIRTAIFNTIVATFPSNLDNSKNLFSFQFQSTTTLVWTTVWAGVSGKAQVGNKTSPCSTGISFKGTFNSTKLTCLCIHHFKMLAKNICLIWSQMNKSSPLLGTQCGRARHNCKFIC